MIVYCKVAGEVHDEVVKGEEGKCNGIYIYYWVTRTSHEI